MSYIGISHFPVLHQQFSSPKSRARGSSESSPDQDVTQDSKDILIERLNDLAFRLSKDSSLEASAVTAIHAEVDHIETLIRGSEKSPKLPQARSHFDSESSSNEEDTFWGPLTPTRSVRMRLPTRPLLPTRQPQITPARAMEIAKAAEDLSLQLANTVLEFQTRKEESDHIHDLLITRAEKAAERILVLEYRISEMEDDFEANQSELKFLRIQLQAIEAQSSQYIPKVDDQELTESIRNWKIDWEDIDKKSKARRKTCRVSMSGLENSRNGVESS